MDEGFRGTAIQQDLEYQAIEHYCELLRERLLRLILEKDELLAVAIPNIEAAYQRHIGCLVFEKFCLQTEISKSKRTIEIIQTSLIHGAKATRESVEKRLELEFREWEERLKEQLRMIEAARESEKSRASVEEARRINRLYRRLVRKLHPDLNPGLLPEYRMLWEPVQEAYLKADAEDLGSLWLIVGELGEVSSKQPSGLEQLRRIEDGFRKSIQKVKSMISEIVTGHPYVLKDRLNDRTWVEEQQGMLRREISALSVEKSKFRILEEQMFKECPNG